MEEEGIMIQVSWWVEAVYEYPRSWDPGTTPDASHGRSYIAAATAHAAAATATTAKEIYFALCLDFSTRAIISGQEPALYLPSVVNITTASPEQGY